MDVSKRVRILQDEWKTFRGSVPAVQLSLLDEYPKIAICGIRRQQVGSRRGSAKR
jgi:hypothetical protein